MYQHEHKILFIPVSEIRSYEFPLELITEDWQAISSTYVESNDATGGGVAVVMSRPVQRVSEEFRSTIDSVVVNNRLLWRFLLPMGVAFILAFIVSYFVAVII